MAPPPPSSELFKKLNALDPGIARRWAQATIDGKRKMTPAGIDAMFFPILDSGVLSENVAKAIMTYVDESDFDPPSLAELVTLVELADEAGELRKAAVPATADDLRMIDLASDPAGLLHVDFVSPTTHVRYLPTYYQVIKQLIRNGDINVFLVKDANLGIFAHLDHGTYESNTNKMFIYGGLNSDQQRNVVVHEMTHAIQDWLDVPGITHKFSEADAHICGAVMSRTRGDNPFPNKIPADEAFEAARFVIGGTATPTNKDWITAYNNVAKMIDRIPIYKKSNARLVNNIEPLSTNPKDPNFFSEKSRFFKILDSLSPATYSPARTRSTRPRPRAFP